MICPLWWHMFKLLFSGHLWYTECMLIEKVRRTINQHQLIQQGAHIVIGLSGGPDSVCLFHVLLQLQQQYELVLHPVHINHQLRPGAAERDQHYVEALCRQYGLECRSFVVDCNALAEALHMTSEEAGRKARYDAFYQTAEELAEELQQSGTHETAEGMRAQIHIAVAQNANDQAETVLFRLLRGTGTDGLAGIAYHREERGFRVIRPLLDVDRDEIEQYCRSQGLEPVQDHTNQEPIYARNQIRLQLLPYLEAEYGKNIRARLVRLAQIAADDKAYLWEQAEQAFQNAVEPWGGAIKKDEKVACGNAGMSGTDRAAAELESGSAQELALRRKELLVMPAAIRHRVLMRAFAEIGLQQDISQERLMAADQLIAKGTGGKLLEFPHGYRLQIKRQQVRLFKTAEKTAQKG